MIALSVCIPVYGVEEYIEKCARSLFEQSQRDSIEFIFVNDNTPDNSIAILKRVLNDYPNRIEQVKIINHERNKGVGATRLTAMTVAQGQYIIHCDSDDWVEPNAYKLMLEEANRTHADLIVGEYYLEQNKGSVPVTLNNYDNGTKLAIDMLQSKIHCGLWNKMVKKDIWIENNITFETGIDMWEDVCTIIPVSICCKSISIIKTPLYHYNLKNQSSYTHSLNSTSLKSMEMVIEKLNTFLYINARPLLPLLNYLKLTVKLNGLVSTSGKTFNTYTLLYPEANHYIPTYSSLSLYWRTALMAVKFKQPWFFKLLKQIKEKIS